MEEDDVAGPDAVGDGLLRLREAPAFHQLHRLSLARGPARKEPHRPLGQRLLVGLQERRRLLAPLAHVNRAAQHNRLVRGQVADAIRRQHVGTQTCLTKHLTNLLGNLRRRAVLGGVGHQDLNIHLILLSILCEEWQ